MLACVFFDLGRWARSQAEVAAEELARARELLRHLFRRRLVSSEECLCRYFALADVDESRDVANVVELVDVELEGQRLRLWPEIRLDAGEDALVRIIRASPPEVSDTSRSSKAATRSAYRQEWMRKRQGS